MTNATIRAAVLATLAVLTACAAPSPSPVGDAPPKARVPSSGGYDAN